MVYLRQTVQSMSWCVFLASFRSATLQDDKPLSAIKRVCLILFIVFIKKCSKIIPLMLWKHTHALKVPCLGDFPLFWYFFGLKCFKPV